MATDGETAWGNTCIRFLQNLWKKRNEHPDAGGAFTRSRDGAPFPEGYVVDDQVAKASNYWVRPPPPTPPLPPPARTPLSSMTGKLMQHLCTFQRYAMK